MIQWIFEWTFICSFSYLSNIYIMHVLKLFPIFALNTATYWLPSSNKKSVYLSNPQFRNCKVPGKVLNFASESDESTLIWFLTKITIKSKTVPRSFAKECFVRKVFKTFVSELSINTYTGQAVQCAAVITWVLSRIVQPQPKNPSPANSHIMAHYFFKMKMQKCKNKENKKEVSNGHGDRLHSSFSR